METIEIDQAILQINQLLEMAMKGKDIIITKNHEPMVRLTSIKTDKKRLPLFGSDKNIITISDDFDETLEDFQEYI